MHKWWLVTRWIMVNVISKHCGLWPQKKTLWWFFFALLSSHITICSCPTFVIIINKFNELDKFKYFSVCLCLCFKKPITLRNTKLQEFVLCPQFYIILYLLQQIVFKSWIRLIVQCVYDVKLFQWRICLSQEMFAMFLDLWNIC